MGRRRSGGVKGHRQSARSHAERRAIRRTGHLLEEFEEKHQANDFNYLMHENEFCVWFEFVFSDGTYYALFDNVLRTFVSFITEEMWMRKMRDLADLQRLLLGNIADEILGA